MTRSIFIGLSIVFALCLATFEVGSHHVSEDPPETIRILEKDIPLLPLVFSIEPEVISIIAQPETNQVAEEMLEMIEFTSEKNERPLGSMPLHLPMLELIEWMSAPALAMEEIAILKVKEVIHEKPQTSIAPLPIVVVPAPILVSTDNLWPIPKRVNLSHVDGIGDEAGISYGTDYSTLEVLLAPDYLMGRAMYLIDLRGHRFDNNTYATNIGVGGRYIPEKGSFCELLGLNAYYDWRQGFIGDYHQIGLGLEVLGRRCDIRANGYIPLGEAKNLNVCNWDYPGGYEIRSSDCEFATYGFNLEVGWLAVRGKDFLLYTATGPYFLSRSTCCFEPMRGFEFRIRPQYKDYLAVEGRVSWDSVYKWVYQTEFIVSLPLYQISHQKGKSRPCRISERQIYQKVERFEVMPLGRKQCWTQNF